MITEKEVRIITQNQGFILSVKKAYEGKAFPFAVTCTLPITFNYQKDSYIHLSYVIETPKENYKFSEGKMDKNKPYTSYTVVVKSRYAEIVNLVTPKQLRKRGFASAILDIVSEIITEYNSLITTQKFMQLKEYTTIKFITGYAKSCDEEPKLDDEQLKNFYERHGFDVDEKRNIMKNFI